jgi:hypothetical protein
MLICGFVLRRLTASAPEQVGQMRTLVVGSPLPKCERSLSGLDPVRWTFLMSRAETRENVQDDSASETLVYARVQGAHR